MLSMSVFVLHIYRHIYVYIDTIYKYVLYAVILDWLHVKDEKTVACTILPHSASSGHAPFPLHAPASRNMVLRKYWGKYRSIYVRICAVGLYLCVSI